MSAFYSASKIRTSCILCLLLISANIAHTQNVIVWGDGSRGQTNVPPAATNVLAVAAGAAHSLARQGDGSVVAWGDNSYGQTNVPSGATNVVAIAAGDYHSLALRADGVLLAWGRNDFGQTNVPTAATNITSIAAGMGHSVATRSDGVIVAWGRNYEHETDVPGLLTTAITVASGCYHTLALLANHTVVSWGLLDSVPSSATNVAAIAAGFEHNVALKADGAVIAWGDNTFGQTNVPASATNIVAIAAGYDYSLALRADGTLITWGLGYYGSTNIPVTLTNVATIAARGDYGVAVVRPGPPQFGPQLAPVETHTGREVVLSANVQGPYPATFQWYHDGNLVAGATNWFLWLPACQATDAGDYVLVATNAFGPATSQSVNLLVHTDPDTFTAVGAWGDNSSGQCAVPRGVANPRAIAAGAFHALALNADGTVAAWGKNSDRQTNVPPSATNIVAVAAGGSHSLALRDDGSVIAWGANWDGQTNVPAAATNLVAIAAGSAHSLALSGAGTVLAWGNNDLRQTNVPALAQGAIAIAAGYNHNLALLSDHTVVAWGLQNTVPASATNVVAISGGWWHSLALRADGSVVAWGDNSYGQCTVPPSATNVVGIAASYYHSLALLANGTVLVWGAGINGVTNVLTGLKNVARISAGQDYSLVMVELGFPRFSSSPEAVVSHTGGKACFEADVSGTSPLALQWFHDGASIEGATSRYLLLTNVSSSSAGTYSLVATNITGLTNSLDSSLNVQSSPALAGNPLPQNVVLGAHVCLPAEVSGLEPLSLQWRLNGVDLHDGPRLSGVTNSVLCLDTAKGEDSGNYSLVASNANGSVTGLVAQISVSSILAWGDNSAGQLEVPIGTTDVVALATGGDHSLALRANGTLVPWGNNSFGQNTVPQLGGSVVAVADGGSHTLALRSDGAVLAWGNNSYGQATVPWFAGRVVAIAAGESHSLALLLDGSVVAWGSNASLQRSVPDSVINIVAIAAGDTFSLALSSDGTLVGWGALPPVPAAATNVVAIAAGARHALALRADGALIAWGGNYYGQTSVPGSVTNIVAIAAGGDSSLALRANGTVVGWGANYFGQTLVPPEGTNIVAISAGGAHSLAMIGTGAPLISLQPRSCSAHVGQPLVLTTSAIGSSPLSWQWFHNGIPILGAVEPFLLLPSIQRSDAGSYTVAVTNPLGETNTQAAILAVQPEPFFTATTTLQTVLVRMPVNFAPKIYGEQPIAYRWQFNGTDLLDGSRVTGAASPQLSLSPTELGDTGDYSLIVSNAFGITTGLVAHLSVTPVAAWGDNNYGQTNVPFSATNVVAIAAGYYHNMVLRSDGSVVAWGNNSYGQTNVPPSATNVVAIAGGDYHNVALRVDGSVVAWGYNYYGQNVPPSATNVVAIAAGGSGGMALRSDHSVVAWGYNSYGQTNVPPSATNVVAIAAGYYHNMALRSDGLVVAWGNNSSGQTNVLPAATNVLAIAAGGYESMALLGENGQVSPFQPIGTPATIGASAMLTAGSLGRGRASFQWQLNGMDLSGATNAALSIPFATWANAGVYRVVVSDVFGSVTGPPMVFTVLRTPLQFDTAPGGIVVSNDGTHLRVLGASGIGPVVILGSGDLHAWEPILTNPPVIGAVEFIAPETGNPAGRFYRAVEGTVAGPLRIDITTLPSPANKRSFPLQLTGLTANGPVIIYASSNLLDWRALFTNPPTIGPLQYREAPPTSQPERFYRASEDR